MGHFYRMMLEAKRSRAKRAKHFPESFPEFVALQDAIRQEQSAKQKVKIAQDIWNKILNPEDINGESI